MERRLEYPFTPMLLENSWQPFDDPNYAFEVKYDGVRMTARAGGGIVLYNRRLNGRTRQYPEIAAQIKALCRNAGEQAPVILDGEIIALSETGLPDFYRVMRRDRATDPGIKFIRENPVYYMVFDITEVGGSLLYGDSYALRRKALEALFQGAETAAPNIRLVDSVRRNGRALFAAAKAEGLEGIVAKRLDSVYTANARSHDWLKIKVEDYKRP